MLYQSVAHLIAPTETFIASFSGLVGSLPTELGGATNLGTLQPSSMLVAARFARSHKAFSLLHRKSGVN